jgi:CRP-like cAMP-binding protein
VLADTWVYRRAEGSWRRAGDLPEVQMILRRKTGQSSAARAITPGGALTPGALRRIKIFADFNDAQLDQLAQFLELKKVPQWTVVVKQGDSGDAMYLVLEGELRARVMDGTKENIIATLGPGEFFGDMAMFDHGPRSADVVANADSVLLILTSVGFERMAKESPSLATPFLQATARTLASRIRANNRRLDRIRRQFSSSGAIQSSAVSASPE